jgi:hypothetical protein
MEIDQTKTTARPTNLRPQPQIPVTAMVYLDQAEAAKPKTSISVRQANHQVLGKTKQKACPTIVFQIISLKKLVLLQK